MNIENTFKSVAGQLGRIGDQASFAGVSDGTQAASVRGKTPTGGASLTVRTTPNDGTVSARRIDSADAEEALKTDALDSLVKSVLNFPPPPMPNFDIMSSDSA